MNYGAIGGVIGHEMGHGFDDQGSKSDARGILRTWWAPDDEAAFKKLVDNLAVQYDGYTALPGLKVNGRLTLGENIGDLGGLSVALRGVSPLAEGQAGAGARWAHGRAALLPVMGAGVAQSAPATSGCACR